MNHTQLLQQMREISNNRNGTKEIMKIIHFIDLDMSYSFKKDVSIYFAMYKLFRVYYDDILIAIIDKKNQYVIIPRLTQERHIKPVKERLNRILMRFCGVHLFQKNKIWYIKNSCGDLIKLDHKMYVPFLSRLEQQKTV